MRSFLVYIEVNLKHQRKRERELELKGGKEGWRLSCRKAIPNHGLLCEGA